MLRYSLPCPLPFVPCPKIQTMKINKNIILKRILTASILSLVYTSIFAFIIYGSLNYPKDHLTFDLVYAFIYFILLYKGYKYLIPYITRPSSIGIVSYKHYVLGYIIFVLYSLVLVTLVGIVPFLLIFDDFVNPSFGPTEIRLNYTVNALVATVYFGVLSSYEIFKSYHHAQVQAEQQQKEIALAQFESLKNQVNPHFLFNSLNVLTSLIAVNPELAERFTEQLSKVYRYVLEHKSEDIVTLKTELDFLQSYIFLVNIRFKDKLNVHVNIPAHQLGFYLPPLCLQLLIENAIKHNVVSKKSPLQINIYTDDSNYLYIENNLQSREENSASTGVGLDNIRKIYNFLTERKAFFGIEGNKYVAKIPLLRK